MGSELRSPNSNTRPFKLVNYFSIASAGMFLPMVLALYYFVTQQSDFFDQVQNQQLTVISDLQNSYAQQQEDVSRRELLEIQESGNVNLTRLFANALWDDFIAPFVAEVTRIPVDHCIAMSDIEVEGKMKASSEKKACFEEVGTQIRKNSGFEEIDKKVYDAMRKSSVFKVKVFDLRGITVYSSQHSQLGASKIDNPGWQGAMQGNPVSELTHRDTFGAFEGDVEDIDVISSYLPVYKPGTDQLVGAFEVYSDVTRFLNRIKDTSEGMQVVAANNLQQVRDEASSNRTEVQSSLRFMLIVVTALLLALFVALYLIVFRADKIIKTQSLEREIGLGQMAQSEKMASLGQMVAGVAHQMNTPIAFSRSNLTMLKDAVDDVAPAFKMYTGIGEYLAKSGKDKITLTMTNNRDQMIERAKSLPDAHMLVEMLDDTLNGLEQMGELVDNLQGFTRLDRAKTDMFDVNQGLKNVVYIARSVIPTGINILEDFGNLPKTTCNPSQLNQVFFNLVNNASQSMDGSGTIRVQSRLAGQNIEIRVTDDGAGIEPDVLPNIFEMYYTTKAVGEGTGMGLGIALAIANEHGGDIDVESSVGVGTTVTVTLPVDAA
ncbi:MAG: HAMP domain-containing histidine kinase [Gammaproteobacteria bacterium]|nr:HAMP domain-containing histidine kinase [Gammaproteobacteria bacterium]